MDSQLGGKSIYTFEEELDIYLVLHLNAEAELDLDSVANNGIRLELTKSGSVTFRVAF